MTECAALENTAENSKKRKRTTLPQGTNGCLPRTLLQGLRDYLTPASLCPLPLGELLDRESENSIRECLCSLWRTLIQQPDFIPTFSSTNIQWLWCELWSNPVIWWPTGQKVAYFSLCCFPLPCSVLRLCLSGLFRGQAAATGNCFTEIVRMCLPVCLLPGQHCPSITAPNAHSVSSHNRWPVRQGGAHRRDVCVLVFLWVCYN